MLGVPDPREPLQTHTAGWRALRVQVIYQTEDTMKPHLDPA